MRKGLGNWVAALVTILLAIAIIFAMYVVGVGTVTKIARSLFGQS